MFLFYVHYTDDQDNQDLGAFVTARTVEEATDLWREWAATIAFGDDADVEERENWREQTTPAYVFLVPPLSTKPMVHHWHRKADEHGAPNVYYPSQQADALEVTCAAIEIQKLTLTALKELLPVEVAA